VGGLGVELIYIYIKGYTYFWSLPFEQILILVLKEENSLILPL